MDHEMKQRIAQLCETVLFDEPLSRLTTIRVGGPAEALLYPKSVSELEEMIRFARQNKLPLFILGAGSNLLVPDVGIRGMVVHLGQGFSKIIVEDQHADEAVVYVEAGVGIPRLVDFTAEQGLSGLEPLAGIPGNVGGSLVMNAGTPDGATGDHIVTVTFLDKEARLQTWVREAIHFEYRKTSFPKGAVVLSARFRLRPGSMEVIKAKVKEYREKRAVSQPLNVPNLGSVFKNPPKRFAGALIEEAGLKGVRVGKARISPKHANFIINEGGATSRDIHVLIGLIKDKVKEKFNITLEPEVRIVGEK